MGKYKFSTVIILYCKSIYSSDNAREKTDQWQRRLLFNGFFFRLVGTTEETLNKKVSIVSVIILFKTEIFSNAVTY